MPGPAPRPPAALNLLRLAQVTQDAPVRLPGTGVRALILTVPHGGVPGGAVVCMDGELLIDFDDGGFAHLKSGDACALDRPHQLRPLRGRCAALLVEGTR